MEEEKKEEIKEENLETKPEEGVKDEKTVEELNTSEEDKKNKQKKNSVILMFSVVGAIVALLLIAAAFFLIPILYPSKTTTKKASADSKGVLSEYKMKGNSLEDFDLVFLKLENNGKNNIYSPLSIKYALAMLSEGSKGATKNQIDAVIGDYKSNKYNNNEHMSFANAMFIRNTIKDQIKDSYTKALAEKYNAEVKLDDFANADNMNKWVSDKTFGLIGDLFDSDKVQQEDFELVNALAIDMNWNNQIQCATGSNVPCKRYSVAYRHETYKTGGMYNSSVDYIYDENGFYPLTFNGQSNVKSAVIKAAFNRYDAVKTIGENKIRDEVGKAYKKWLNTEEGKYSAAQLGAEVDVDKYLNQYINDLDSNYNKEDSSTDFMLYTDDNVKVFAKDLKEYDGTTLQYVGIMPTKEDLNTYITKVDAEQINSIISNLKTMKKENFKDGVVTLVRGIIPMFKYDSTLDLMNDLQKLGIKDAFDDEKADLTAMIKQNKKGTNYFISSASHKANIEFSNDGIKAAAATREGGAGATSGGFDYFYKIPVEEIDLTINKPFMYIIRDKKTGEIWFAGSVYEGQQRSVAINENDYRLTDWYKENWDNYQ